MLYVLYFKAGASCAACVAGATWGAHNYRGAAWDLSTFEGCSRSTQEGDDSGGKWDGLGSSGEEHNSLRGVSLLFEIKQRTVLTAVTK